MNRKEAIVVGISIFAILTGTVFAETNSPNTQASATTLQTVGIDIPKFTMFLLILRPC